MLASEFLGTMKTLKRANVEMLRQDVLEVVGAFVAREEAPLEGAHVVHTRGAEEGSEILNNLNLCFFRRQGLPDCHVFFWDGKARELLAYNNKQTNKQTKHKKKAVRERKGRRKRT